MKRCKKEASKKGDTKEVLKCFNLERILIAAQYNLETPAGVGMDQYMEGVDMVKEFID